ncbi:MAG: InlB B-repeat-containing protein [Treponema sp.]|nr:InlB B-repeat-containing protein [Treponema sp.]
MSKNHFGTTIIALFAILLTMSVSSCKGNAVNVYYTITYETAYGTAPESKKVLSGTIIAAQDLPELTADGYTFEGWYIDSTKITPELNYTVNSNITLTAKWTEVTTTPPAPAPVYYTITYVTERAQAPSAKSVLSGTVLAASDLPELTAEGYVFEGWYIGTTKITEGYEVSGNITLTAKWEKAFTVTYVSTYGQAPEPINVAYKTELTYEDLPELSDDDDDHEFEGWYFGSTKVLPGYKVYTDMTLTAYWNGNEPVEVKYTVSYTSSFGKAPDPWEFKAGESLTGGDLLTMIRPGYEFAGWYFGNIKMEVGYPVMQNMVLVAKWNYTITYITEHGIAPQTVKVLEETALTEEHLQTLSCDGYHFANWTTGGQTVNVGYVIRDNITLTANWTVPNLGFLVSIVSSASQSETDFKLTAVKSGSDYRITATAGFDMYFWSVDAIDDEDNFLYADEIDALFTSGNVPAALTQNTLTFNEQLLPEAVNNDGTYRVYCQAIKKLYDASGNPSGFERAGLDLVVIKM